VGVFALTLGVLALAPTSSAAPETNALPFEDLGPAPVSGTLDNQVNYEIDLGVWGGLYWSLTNAGPTTFSFDRPVDIRFGIDGLNATNEAVQLPEGTELYAPHDLHVWDEDNFIVNRLGGACSGGCVSTFTLANTTDLVVQPVFNLAQNRGVAFVEVTYDLPVVSVNGPADGGVYTQGDGTALDFACADGTGEVFGGGLLTGTTADGEEVEAFIGQGDPVDMFGPGEYTLQVACVDEHGAIDSQSVSYTIEPPECTEDGFQVFEPPYINLHPPSNGLSDGIHKHTERDIARYVDPLLTGLGLPALQPIVHEVNCEVIVPVEDAVDDLLIPIVEALDLGTLIDDLIGGLLGGLIR
jgi:hypothetical protein